MIQGDEEICDKDDRTIFVRGFNEKMTEKLLYELFFQAGPIERVAIPKDTEGNLKTFGFVTYKHLSSVNYAINIFAGTRLFGREIAMKNRRTDQQQQFTHQSQPAASLLHGYHSNSTPYVIGELSPTIPQQQLIQQQLIKMATGQNIQNFVNAGAQMFAGASSSDQFASTRGDSSGSHRDHYVERQRFENRSSRSNPYRRSRSRSPQQKQRFRSRERSPTSHNQRSNERGRKTDDRSNYHRWGKR